MAKLIMLAGNSGVGKTYVLQHFPCLEKNMRIVLKGTTRMPRTHEPKNQTIELVFNTPKEEILKRDYHYKYRDNYYGFNKQDIERIINAGINAILVVRRVDCIRKLKSQFPDSLAILVKAGNRHTIASELSARGMSDMEITQRLNEVFEIELEQEYADNSDVFNFMLHNYYNHKFLLEFNGMVMTDEKIVEESHK